MNIEPKPRKDIHFVSWPWYLSVNVHHVLSRTLVRSYMIVVNYISSDAKTMKVGYSSEPILAFGARELLRGSYRTR